MGWSRSPRFYVCCHRLPASVWSLLCGLPEPPGAARSASLPCFTASHFCNHGRAAQPLGRSEGAEAAMAVDWGIVAGAVHILAVVVWIGGVWLVTTALLPGLKQKPPEHWAR